GISVVAEPGDLVTVGDQGSLAGIQGQVVVAGATGATLIVDDSADTIGRRVTIDPPRPNGPYYTHVTGLAPGGIAWDFTGVSGQVVLLGGNGNDAFVTHGIIADVSLTINGGAGRDLLIAGQTQVSLFGGPDEDILIAGFTDYDYDAASIDAILAEWS